MLLYQSKYFHKKSLSLIFWITTLILFIMGNKRYKVFVIELFNSLLVIIWSKTYISQNIFSYIPLKTCNCWDDVHLLALVMWKHLFKNFWKFWLLLFCVMKKNILNLFIYLFHTHKGIHWKKKYIYI